MRGLVLSRWLGSRFPPLSSSRPLFVYPFDVNPKPVSCDMSPTLRSNHVCILPPAADANPSHESCHALTSSGALLPFQVSVSLAAFSIAFVLSCLVSFHLVFPPCPCRFPRPLVRRSCQVRVAFTHTLSLSPSSFPCPCPCPFPLFSPSRASRPLPGS